MDKESKGIKAVTSRNFIRNVAKFTVAVEEKRNDSHKKDVWEQYKTAALAQLVTGKPAEVVLRPNIEDGVINGFECEITGDAIEAMAQMTEEEIVTKAVPQIVHFCDRQDVNPASLLAGLLGGVMSDDGDDEEDAPKTEAA